MPLDQSGSAESVGNNIRTEISSGKKRNQAVAIALSVQRRANGLKDRKPKGRISGLKMK